MADRSLIGTALAVSGSRVTVHSGRLAWRALRGITRIGGSNVVIGVVDSQGRRPCRFELEPAQAVRLAALLLAPVDSRAFGEGLERACEPDREGES